MSRVKRIPLHKHRSRTHYGTFRRGGYPLGSGGIESSNTCICHVRLKRSGAWWYDPTLTPDRYMNGLIISKIMGYRILT
jgi:hypothetical protein